MTFQNKIPDELFQRLLDNGEGLCVDYKKEHYFRPDGKAISEDKKLDFLKDVMAMVNTKRESSAYIIIGVEEIERINGKRGRVGSTSIYSVDDKNIIPLLRSSIDPQPIIYTYSHLYNNVNLEIIEIPLHPYVAPCRYTKSDGKEKVLTRDIYIRSGSVNVVASGDDILTAQEWLNTLRNKMAKSIRGFVNLNEEYWNQVRKKDASTFLTNLNSNKEVVSSAIVNDLIANTRLVNLAGFSLDDEFQNYLSSAEPLSVLIEMVGPPGQGKSTSLLKIGYKYHNDFQVFLVKDKNWIEHAQSENEKPALILLDNASKYAEEINYYASKLEDKFQNGFVLIIAEQESLRRKLIFDKTQFSERHEVWVECVPGESLERIWEFLYQKFADTDETQIIFKDAKAKFIKEKKDYLIADRLIDLFMSLGNENLMRKVTDRMDWHEWQQLTTSCSDNIKSLFNNVAWTAQYNCEYPIKFLDKNEYEIVRGLLSSTHSAPLVFDDEKHSFGLRHQKIGECYFRLHPEIRADRNSYFRSYCFDSFDSEPKIKLFRWLQKSQKFLNEFREYNPKRRFDILFEYHQKNKGSEQGGKSYYESVKICYNELDRNKAYELLDASEYERLYTITLKATYLMIDGKYEAAKDGRCS